MRRLRMEPPYEETHKERRRNLPRLLRRGRARRLAYRCRDSQASPIGRTRSGGRASPARRAPLRCSAQPWQHPQPSQPHQILPSRRTVGHSTRHQPNPRFVGFSQAKRPSATRQARSQETVGAGSVATTRTKEDADEVEWTPTAPLGLSLSSQDSATRLIDARVPCGSRSEPDRITGRMLPWSKRHSIPVSRERRPWSCPGSAASAIEERPRAQKVGQRDHLQESKV